ncbi:c-type cytochrome [Aquisalimonas asiatica]|uniref:Cytochrome c n=1 Tax=Aquisalimonas asiatica TaxID=406100 RepID=A0A1H8UG82_9GAMM|nr:c-type cytochrome [Aquisalimonas asiatica]SEP02096.1 cytochrome c [Aquisalimonas asiatica]
MLLGATRSIGWVLVLLAPLPAVADNADLVRGERIFITQCAGCHAVAPGSHRAGPSLHNILNRPAGAVSEFQYSPAMENADVVWTPETLDAFLENPEQVVPGSRMVFWGLDERERELVIRYLREISSD